jgi:diadenylate cyclase
MSLYDRFQGLLQRLSTYSPLEAGLELLVIGVVVFVVLRFVQGTRAAGALKGLLLLLIAVTIASRLFGTAGSFQRLNLLYDRFLALVAVALVVIFQPELRRALVRLGETPFLRGTPKDIKFVVGEITAAASYLSRAKFGAIIAVERQIGLAGIVEGGTPLNAALSARLLQTIFFPGSALHDLAVIVRGKAIHAAGVQLPLAEPSDMPEEGLGSRHRAAVGLSKECDAVVVVVSEETGGIRLAERGRLSDRLTPAELRDELERRLTSSIRSARRQAAASPSPERVAEPSEAPDPNDPNQASLSGHAALTDDTDPHQRVA